MDVVPKKSLRIDWPKEKVMKFHYTNFNTRINSTLTNITNWTEENFPIDHSRSNPIEVKGNEL